MNSTIYKSNSTEQNQALQRILSRAASSGNTDYYTWTTARNGEPVPEYNHVSLHSQYNPVLEAERTVAAQPLSGCTVFWGLGGGYIIREYLKKMQTTGDNPFAKILIIEPDAAGLQSILDNCDVADILSHPAVTLSLYQCQEDTVLLEQFIQNNFNPVLQKTFACIPLRSVAMKFADRFDQLQKCITDTIVGIKADFSVQAHFGKIWVTNILKNLAAGYCGTIDDLRLFCKKTGKQYAVVVAAGPSLESAIPFIQKKRTEIFLAATDTAYQTLAEYNIVADVLVSIDGQAASHLHIMKGLNVTPFLAADMCANPVLLRTAQKVGCTVAVFAGGHPLSRAASRFFKDNSLLYTAAGTVTAAAVDIAAQIGFTTVILAGADFANIGGKPYARGTYLDDLYCTTATRTNTAETTYTSLIFRTECARNGTTYTSPLLSRYRRILETFCTERHINLIYWNQNTAKMPIAAAITNIASVHPEICRHSFFSYYKDLLQNLRQELSRKTPFTELSPNGWATLYTVLPSAAWFSFHRNLESAVQDAITYTLDKLANFIDKSDVREKTLL